MTAYITKHRNRPSVDAKPPAALRPREVLIPKPPAVQLQPGRKRAIVTVATGEDVLQWLAVTGPYMQAYAERVDADYVAFDWSGADGWPMSSKYVIATAFDSYERMAFADADVLFTPQSVNIFDLCREDEMGVVDELFHHRGPMSRMEVEYLKLRKEFGFKSIPHIPWYLNTGVMVIPRSHRHIIEPPARPLPAEHLAEQHHTNAMLLDSGLPYRLLDRRANWQEWWDRGFVAAPPDAVLHFSGMRHGRADAIQAAADRHPLTFSPGKSTFPEWSMDARHVQWIHSLLMTGKFRRVLEIGCFRGYSARALLDALRVGKIEELHLCDVYATHELRSLTLGTKAVVHQCRSAELLEKDAAFDLVIVDGNHYLETVAEETRLLLAGGVPTIMAHDTNATAAGYPECEGPAHLYRMLQAAGYHCVEDHEERLGEATHRGLLFASRDAGLTELASRVFEATTPR